MTYPAGLVVRKKRCLVVGGGTIAFRKITGLLEAGADVISVSPVFSRDIFSLHDIDPRLTLVQRLFVFEDLDGVFLVIAATDDAKTNHSICESATARSILCCSVNTPDVSTFHCMATIRLEGLTIGISSGGTDPALVKKMKMRISEALG